MRSVKYYLLIFTVLFFADGFVVKKNHAYDKKMCYENRHGVPPLIDYEILWFTLSNNIVKGEFNWLPALKDRRIGSFNGHKINDNSLDVVYSFYQEGFNSQIKLTIKFDENQVMIEGERPSLGLNRTLARVNCIS
ncbi:hypothetical protein QF117_11365 [Vibrio sp. YMD68]|uniref:hypothetical protein n=1 Tax=Vibrio sp. YMD68 TaxID=3042300 RepID=UPI00249C467A|nr:hypothetical protein [Vibrio sp. YMD68]WGW01379.1 hypothetical protein QF117_11365 [Vibrio sp. YMD68]